MGRTTSCSLSLVDGLVDPGGTMMPGEFDGVGVVGVALLAVLAGAWLVVVPVVAGVVPVAALLSTLGVVRRGKVKCSAVQRLDCTPIHVRAGGNLSPSNGGHALCRRVGLASCEKADGGRPSWHCT